ncbi:MAG: ABC transporter substrate-binding protein [Dehalococcoidia bacterium]|jgi:putative hydroxymethylpyrimidine transport system substrate-binding protein|nr:ABC transporter substrate-binding protein [Dehalococcoidia bacterium]
MKKFLLLIAVLVLPVVATCSDGESEEIVLTLDWFPNANHAGIYEAVDRGFFADEGLDVSVVPPADPSAILSLVASGQSDFGMFYQPDLLQARSAGVPVVAVAGVVQKPLNSMMALESSGIDRPGKLAGKKVGYPGIPWNEAMLTTMLETDGLKRSDVELVDVGFALTQALLAGTVDAVVGAYWTHESIVMENEGYESFVILPDDWGVPTYYELILVASEKTVRDRPETVEKFVKAFSKGYAQALGDPQGAIDTLIEANPESVDEEVDRAGVELLVPLWESPGQPFGSLAAERWSSFADWMKSQSLIDASLDPNAAFDASFAAK